MIPGHLEPHAQGRTWDWDLSCYLQILSDDQDSIYHILDHDHAYLEPELLRTRASVTFAGLARDLSKTAKHTKQWPGHDFED